MRNGFENGIRRPLPTGGRFSIGGYLSMLSIVVTDLDDE